MTMDFSSERLSYEKGQLLETELPNTPVELVKDWVNTAVEQQLVEPYAMSLATCGNKGVPSVRTVLMREITQPSNGGLGVVFYSNYDSAKGQNLEQNPNAEVLFFWHSLERQVRITGSVRKLSLERSQAYFAKRPKDSQIAAWVSEPQSGVVASREQMEANFTKLKEEYATKDVTMPDFWGGYELVANQVEFWQGRANRMHDRIRYTLQDDGTWLKERLMP